MDNKSHLLVSGLILFLTISSSASDPPEKGAITADMIAFIKESVPMDAPTKAIQNAVSGNEIKALALNREMLGTLDHHFAHRIPVSSITNQKSSGRCWLFTALNVVRPKVIEKYNLKSFEFSQNYLFFWDQLEKANLFLEAVIQTRQKDFDDREVEWLFRHPIGDGGVWNMMPSLVEKYGLVPKEIMPESHNSENTAMMRRLIRRKLREQGLQLREWHKKGKSERYLHKRKTELLAEIYRILIISLGTPPERFTWRYLDANDSLIVGKTYTPLEFYQEVVPVKLNDYVMLMNDPTREYYQLYEIEYDRNRYDSQNWTYINLPIEEVKQYAKRSILANEAMYFSCDVGRQLDSDRGLLSVGLFDYDALFGLDFALNKRDRILSYESASTHGMALIGLDTTAAGTVTKWLLENSWGAERGHEGFLTMTNEWFGEYMFRLVVLKQFLPQKVLAVLQQKPIKLPPWDRMY